MPGAPGRVPAWVAQARALARPGPPVPWAWGCGPCRPWRRRGMESLPHPGCASLGLDQSPFPGPGSGQPALKREGTERREATAGGCANPLLSGKGPSFRPQGLPFRRWVCQSSFCGTSAEPPPRETPSEEGPSTGHPQRHWVCHWHASHAGHVLAGRHTLLEYEIAVVELMPPPNQQPLGGTVLRTR